jgi:hypothetical protein
VSEACVRLAKRSVVGELADEWAGQEAAHEESLPHFSEVSRLHLSSVIVRSLFVDFKGRKSSGIET